MGDGLIEPLFWQLMLVNMLGQFAVQTATGLMVARWRVRVNYTRKINHFFLFFFPMVLTAGTGFQDDVGTAAIKGAFSVLILALYVEAVRDRSWLVRTMFVSFDRPEDRPFTLTWLWTQIGLTWVVAVPLIAVTAAMGHPALLLIAVLVNGLGDGLAEPVGVAFGRHTYTTRALFTDRLYTRSLEGSACVFLSAIFAVWAYQAGVASGTLAGVRLTDAELWTLYALMPPLMALTEAKSPHTWDSPFLFLVGGGVPLLVVWLI